MDKLESVVIRNTNKTPASFTDHSGRPQNLGPVFTSTDTVKIMVPPDNIQAAKIYTQLTQAGYAVVLSEGLQDLLDNMNPTTKLFIQSNSNASPEVRARAEWLRQQTAEAGVVDRASAGRLARAKAEAQIKQNPPVQAPEIKPEIKLTPKTAPEIPSEVKEAISSLNSTEGEEITEQNLSVKPMVEIKALAVDLGITIPAGISKSGLVKMIVEQVNKIPAA
jgi:hypothetical protein